MRREARIWESGVPAASATATGDATVKAIFVHYKMHVSFDVDGRPYGGVQEFETIGAGASTVSAPAVRYDREDPEAFATSWGVGSTAGRWRWVLAMLGVAVVVDVIMGLQLRATAREVRRLKAIAERGDEVAAEILSQKVVTLSNGQSTPHVLVTWRGGGHGPFTTQVDTRRGRVGEIALLSEDGSVGMLLTDRLYPLAVTDAEIAAATPRSVTARATVGGWERRSKQRSRAGCAPRENGTRPRARSSSRHAWRRTRGS